MKRLFQPLIKEHGEHRLIRYAAQDFYKVVQDINEYKSFLPYCKRSTIVKRRRGNDARRTELEADLTIGFDYFTETYRSHVELIR